MNANSRPKFSSRSVRSSLITKFIPWPYYLVVKSPSGHATAGKNTMFSATNDRVTSSRLYFGWLLQNLGKKFYAITVLTGCALLTYLLHEYIRNCVLIWSIFFKFWLGFGTGGDYPLPAVILLGPKQPGLCGFSHIGYSALAEQITVVFGAVAAIVAVSRMFVKVCKFKSS